MSRPSFWVLIALAALLAAGCSTPTPTLPPAPTEGSADPAADVPTEPPADAAPTVPPTPAEPVGVTDTAELIAALQAAGIAVEMGERIEQGAFSTDAQVIRLGEQDVQVFEYADEGTRAADSSSIGQDGATIGGTAVTWAAPPHFWAAEKLLVLYVGTDQATIELLSAVLGDPLFGGSEAANPLPPATVLDVREMVAAQLGVPGPDVEIVSYEAVEWPDACLGLAEEGEMCAQVVTPGWLIVFNANGQELEFHTDESGENVRIK